MRLLTVFFIFALVSGILATASLNENKSEVTHLRVRRGLFENGCPFNEYECTENCLSVGHRTGYCSGLFKLSCTCESWEDEQSTHGVRRDNVQRPRIIQPTMRTPHAPRRG